MEFQEVVRRRRMVRAFEDRPLPREVVERILDNARRVPSAGWTQGTEFLVLERAEDRRRFWEASFPDRQAFGRPDVFNAPLVVVVCSSREAYDERYAEPDKSRARTAWAAPWWDIDAGFAALMMLLTAVDAGLGALLFGTPHADAVSEAFAIPERFRMIGAVAVGHPAPDPPSPSLRRGRRLRDEVIHRGQW